MKGRKPKPTHLKVLAGNPGKRPLNDKEPKPAPCCPYAPRWLDDVARREWKRIVPKLYKLGIMTEIDIPALEIYCNAYALWKQTAEKLAEMREKDRPPLQAFKRNDGVELKKHPLVNIADQAAALALKVMTEFGMTPSARARIKVERPPEEEDFFGY